MAYSNTGEGMHRFVDPADGETYLYAMTFLDDAQRIFAAFDQPDLKAPVDPHGDRAAGVDGRRPTAALAANPAPGRWEFAPTAPLATYFVSLIAGPYHVRRAEHDGIPLGVYCRRSLAAHLDADAEEIFTITRQCLDRFHELFAERYPFGKYDQAFVPEFNAGAMENPGLVTFRDDYVFRSAVTDTRARAAGHHDRPRDGPHVVRRPGHHALVGRPVAERVLRRVPGHPGHRRGDPVRPGVDHLRACAARPGATPPTSARPPTRSPRRRSPTPTQAPAQLRRHLVRQGRQRAAPARRVARRRGVPGRPERALRRAPRSATPPWPTCWPASSAASGRDLTDWAERWLRQPAGQHAARRRSRVDADGRYTAVAVVQTAPPSRTRCCARTGSAWAATPIDGTVRARSRSTSTRPPTAGGPVLGELTGEPAAELLLLNDGDLTFAKVRLDPASADAVPLVLPGLADPLARALLWERGAGRGDRRRAAGRRPGRPDGRRAAGRDRGDHRGGRARPLSRDLVDRYLDPLTRAAALAAGRRGVPAAAGRRPGRRRRCSSPPRAGLIAATTDADLLTGWLAGRDVPDGLAVDAELRWAVLRRLVVLGAAGAAEIAAEAAADPSATGARAGRPLPGGPARPGRQGGRLGDHRPGHRRCPTGWWRRPPRGSGSPSRPS